MDFCRNLKMLRSGMMGVAIAGLAAPLVGCPAGDDGGGSGTQSGTTLPSGDDGSGSADGMMDDGMDTSTGSAACGEDPSTSFATDIQPIIEANCLASGAGAACHTLDGSWPTFDLSGSASSNYDKLVDANSPTNGLADGGYTLVIPCNTDDSFLLDKLDTGDRVPEGLCRMPITVYPTPAGQTCADVEMLLAQSDLDTITQWINDGAPE